MIRRYKKEDSSVLYDIFKDAILDSTGDEYSLKERQAWSSLPFERFLEILSREEVYVYEDGAILGFMTLDGDYLDLLYVRSDHQRKGIARALVAMLPKDKKITVHSSMTALPFFLEMGFVMIKESYALRDEERLIYFEMVKDEEGHR